MVATLPGFLVSIAILDLVGISANCFFLYIIKVFHNKRYVLSETDHLFVLNSLSIDAANINRKVLFNSKRGVLSCIRTCFNNN